MPFEHYVTAGGKRLRCGYTTGTCAALAAAAAARLLLTGRAPETVSLRTPKGWVVEVPVVRCSNFIGEALDGAGAEGFSAVLLVGHIGKLVKLAGGIMNTHSRWADGRAELFCAHAALCGADRDTAQALMDSATADQCLSVLERAGLREPVMDSLLEAVQRHLERRAAEQFSVGAVLFSNQYGLLGMTRGAKEILEAWQTS